MHTFGYPEALHVLFEQRKSVVMGSSQNSWYLKYVYQENNPIASIPVIVRVNLIKNGPNTRGPWPPNNGDMHNTSFARRDGKDPGPIIFINGTSAWAFHELLRNGKCIRRIDWPPKQHLRDIKEPDGRLVVKITLKNGKQVKDEFHPDFFDLAGTWELYTDHVA